VDYSRRRLVSGSILWDLISGHNGKLYGKIVTPLWSGVQNAHRSVNAPNSKVGETWEEICIVANKFLEDEC